MVSHFPLQPVRNNPRHDGRCPGGDDTSRKIRRNVVLGNDITTDVFEWQLRDLGSTTADRARALAIAAALREALAKTLGVEAEDMGIVAAPSLLEDDNRSMSVFLFDRASGGSGFSPLALDRLEDLVAQALRNLDCPADCASGCPECILRGDIQYDQALMDRPGAHQVLSAVKERLTLPDDLRIFDQSSRALQQSLPDWIGPRMRSGHVTDVAIFMHGAPHLWDLRDLAAKLPRRDTAGLSKVVLAKETLPKLEASEKVDLVRFLAECGAKLHAVDRLPLCAGKPVLCQFSYEGHYHAVGVIAHDTALPDGNWGRPEAGPIILGNSEPTEAGPALSAEKLALFKEGNSVHRDAADLLDGPAGRFGHRFWTLIKGMRPQLFRDVPLISVSYSDRYLRAPLPVRLLFEILRTMPDRSAKTRFEVLSARLDRGERWLNHDLQDNWSDDGLRLQTMQTMLTGADVRILNKRDCPHPRSFSLEWQDGRTARIHLDQGLGSWTVDGGHAPRFDVTQDPAQQARTLEKLTFEVRNRQRSSIETPIWVTW